MKGNFCSQLLSHHGKESFAFITFDYGFRWHFEQIFGFVGERAWLVRDLVRDFIYEFGWYQRFRRGFRNMAFECFSLHIS